MYYKAYDLYGRIHYLRKVSNSMNYEDLEFGGYYSTSVLGALSRKLINFKTYDVLLLPIFRASESDIKYIEENLLKKKGIKK